MWCLVSQPNAVVIEVKLDHKAKGLECLEKVCECLGINKECDYFGLQYKTVKGQDVWLNLRNVIEHQVAGVHPYRFALRVKFWVPPHLLLQESTRHQFYLHAKLELCEGRLRPTDNQTVCKTIALLAQAEFGDCDDLVALVQFYAYWCEHLDVSVDDEESIDRIQKLYSEMRGMKQTTAEYWLIKEVSGLHNFGEEVFEGRTASGSSVLVGVGPHGISLNFSDQEQQMIPYTAIRSAASHRRVFEMWYLAGVEHTETLIVLKLESSLGANTLYRALTEKHAFYSCETVRGAVTSQYIRDLKGTIISIFNEDSPLGKKYVFDIQRTCREVHDNARRALYEKQNKVTPPTNCCCVVVHGPSSPEHTESNTSSSRDSYKLAKLIDALTCRICMDATIDHVFFPCGHVIACGTCATRCETCPLCRGAIDESRHVFIPTLADLPDLHR
ncbi:Zinc finger, RING-type,PH domain-like,FERM/acyl-CoA-binding protein, 3-helical bundle,Ubiquitin-related [Cinara cedri]|uniref:RING-type E3 ubiquitin transferase n=1 Tax=Cinara cedri TaxID=506608 RepID=A0A5E4M415_9HEMI|nr:Zinc finger, RING-type,PH domain-like,FERM/acyl-CoA-binding protein, 3-helical bundle,Ubiquitin-related [Cinara cedri]